MFNDMRWFPFGITPEPNVLVKTAEMGVPAIVPRGKGNAVVVAAGGCRTVGQQQVLLDYGSTPQHGTSCPVNSLQNFYLLVMLGLEPGTSRL
eukprot:1893278-Pleurochrysis_carterae.AAC.1